jgi:hypothetical protein
VKKLTWKDAEFEAMEAEREKCEKAAALASAQAAVVAAAEAWRAEQSKYLIFGSCDSKLAAAVDALRKVRGE